MFGVFKIIVAIAIVLAGVIYVVSLYLNLKSEKTFGDKIDNDNFKE